MNRCWPLLGLLAVVLATAPARADKKAPPPAEEPVPFFHPKAHFSLQMPAGWEVMPTSLVEQINLQSARKPPFQEMSFDGGFWVPGRPGAPLRYPYVLVQIRILPEWIKTHENVRTYMTQDNPNAKLLPGPVTTPLKDLQPGEVFLDRANNRGVAVQVLQERTSKLQPIQWGWLRKGAPDQIEVLRVIAVGFLGKDHVVLLHYYDWEEEFPKRAGQFQAMADSFRFDPGFGFEARQRPAAVAPQEAPTRPTTEEVQRNHLLLGGVLAAGLGLLSTLFLLRSRSAEQGA